MLTCNIIYLSELQKQLTKTVTLFLLDFKGDVQIAMFYQSHKEIKVETAFEKAL